MSASVLQIGRDELLQLERSLSREWLETFLTRTGARLWIQHDLTAARTWKKSPAFYD